MQSCEPSCLEQGPVPAQCDEKVYLRQAQRTRSVVDRAAVYVLHAPLQPRYDLPRQSAGFWDASVVQNADSS
jgi:hypothetical protein